MICGTQAASTALGRFARVALLVAAVAVMFPGGLAAQWRVEAWFGDAWNVPTELTLKQQDQPDIHIDADWSTRPWSPTWYYSGRIAHWSGDAGWGAEYMHHKLYLDNLPQQDVTHFRITNGVNHIIVQRLWRRRGWELSAGAGPTLVVPITIVRGKRYGERNGVFGSRYELGGATLHGSVARRLKLLPYTYGSLTAKGTISYLDVPIADGRATTMNYALHLQYGLSLQSKP